MSTTQRVKKFMDTCPSTMSNNRSPRHPGVSQPVNQQQRHPTFKIGIEVKAVFTKNHPSIQNPEADPLIEHRIMFIHWILQKFIVGHLAQVIWRHWAHSSPPLSGSIWMRTTTQHTSCTTSLNSGYTSIQQTRCRKVAGGSLFQRGLLGQRRSSIHTTMMTTASSMQYS